MNRETTLTAYNGRDIDALTIFTYSIYHMHKKAVEVIREEFGYENVGSGDVQWVLTVPAIWKPAAKQFMREAAYKVSHLIR